MIKDETTKKEPFRETEIGSQLKNISDALVFLCNNLMDEVNKDSETEYDEFVSALSLYGRMDYYIGTLNIISDKIRSMLD